MQTVLRRPRPCIFCAFRLSRDPAAHPSRNYHDRGDDYEVDKLERGERRKPKYAANRQRRSGRDYRFGDEDDPSRIQGSLRRDEVVRNRHNEMDAALVRRASPQARLDYLEENVNARRQWIWKPSKEDFKRPSAMPTRRDSPRGTTSAKPRSAGPRDFAQSVRNAVEDLEKNYQNDQVFLSLDLEEEKLQAEFDVFKYKMFKALAGDTTDDQLYARLKRIFPQTDESGFNLETKYAFYGYLITSRFSKRDLEAQNSLANLRFPSEWYPATRPLLREIHLHVGPTNSGKTYHALKRLEEAESGLYAGPLRLLAHEVYMRLNARGKNCNLITGDDRRLPPTLNKSDDATMSSCTVEMIPLNTRLDVAVIDEIQMIGSEDRGWAWTQAVLGIKARELHLCGEDRSVPIIRELAALCGDRLHIHRYNRLSPLKMMDKSLNGNIRGLQKGDCIVAFSIMEIHGLRQMIEKTLKCKVAIIYGSLPPETRAQQAQLFNDPDSGYDILVASNAIGMGLNLSIKRLIFHTAHRFNGATYEALSIPEAKQIAGRAGRYSTSAQDIKRDTASNLDIVGPDTDRASSTSPAPPREQTVGLVTTLDKLDYPIIERAMNSDAEPIRTAGIQPPAYVMERFARLYPPNTPFAYLLIRLHEISRTTGRFHLCDLRQAIAIADAIGTVEGLTTTDKLIFVSSPIEPRRYGESALAKAYARLVAENRGVDITSIKELDLELLQDNYVANRKYLNKLETLHKGVIVWLWLSYRFMGVFINRELAAHVKELVEKRIEDTLQQMAFDFDQMRRRRERAITDILERESEKQEGDGESDDFENMPEDPEKVPEWLRSMAEKAPDHTVEQPNSDVTGRNERADEDQASAQDSPDTLEPPAAVVDESLTTEFDRQKQ